MLNSLPVVLIVSTALGFLAGLGVGGGSLLILWLTLILDTQPSIARAMNLMFFLPSALIASVFRKKQGSLNLQKIFPGILSGSLTAAIFSLISRQIGVSSLQKLFGILLLITSIKELMYKPKN